MRKFIDKVKASLLHLKFRIRYSRDVFENEVVDIRMSNENIKRYSIQNLRKEFFSISIKSKDDIFKYLFYLVALLSLFLLPYASVRTGVSDKEVQQQEQAEMLYNYYAHHDTSILESDYARSHTQLIDFICCCIGKWLNLSNVYVLRHAVGAFFAWLLILLVGSFLMNLFAWRAALFGVVFMLISPHFIGQSFGNLADVPFAFFYLLALYQIYTLIGELPLVKWKRLVFIVLTIIAANAIHVGGFVLIHYLIIFTLLSFVFFNPLSKFFTRKYQRNFLKLITILLAVTGVVYLSNLILPLHFNHSSAAFPRDAILQMAENQPVASFIWGGKVVSSHDLTWTFILSRMQISIPLLIIIGIITHLVVAMTIARTVRPINYFLFTFALLYPLWCLMGEEFEVYDGWSVYLMIYPLVVIFSVAGFEGILRKIDDKYTNFVIVSSMVLLMFMPLRHVLFHNTAPAVYFNELSGGISAAYGKYPIDPYEQCNKQVCEWVLRDCRAEEDSVKVHVYTDGGRGCDVFFAKDTARFSLTHSGFYEKDSLGWDYFVSFVDRVPASQLRNKSWESMPAVKSFYIENKVIAVVMRNEMSPLFAPPVIEDDEADALETSADTLM